MNEQSNRDFAAPLALSTTAFEELPLCMDLAACWTACRGDKMLPTKHDFEGAILGYPDVLPQMTMLGPTPGGGLNYLFTGSDRVFRHASDHTGQSILETVAPLVQDLLAQWALAVFKRPFGVFWEQRHILTSGAPVSGFNLGLVLADENGQPVALAIAPAVDEAHSLEIERKGFLIGSEGVDVTPIDIGLGVPDLARSVSAS